MASVTMTDADSAPVLDFFASVIHSAAWPFTLVVLAFVFRREIVSLIPKLSEASLLGTGWKFAQKEAEAATLVAAHDAPATAHLLADLPAGMPERVGRVVQAWGEIEGWLRDRVRPEGINPTPDVRELIEAALRQGKLTSAQAESVRGLYAMRNLAVHGRASEVTETRVQEFLTLAGAIQLILNIPSPSEAVSAAITGQSELATMPYGQLKSLLERDYPALRPSSAQVG